MWLIFNDFHYVKNCDAVRPFDAFERHSRQSEILSHDTYTTPEIGFGLGSGKKRAGAVLSYGAPGHPRAGLLRRLAAPLTAASLATISITSK
jgi:hypothetical protein